ncbi:MAG: TnsD family transposase [Stenomitos rutilans HA7619-LM2]|nr:TnsD family transposase [Stenomitos rutilans HA7619-LM2]
MMIGCFPNPYPDELLYSICARFHQRVQYPNKKGTIRELFGDEAAIAVVDLPSNVGSLVSALPPGSPHTVERLINRHTLFPFFAPFLHPEQAQQLLADMEGARGPAIKMRSGVMASTVQPPEWLRFCPLCVRQDKQEFGEPYWHRLHQLPGVEVCPEHNVRLLDSQVRIQNPQTRHEFVAAEQGIQLPKSRSFSLLNPHHEILLKIAQDAAWLLKQTTSPPGLEVLSKRYRELLAERGLATYSGRVRVSDLLREFCQFYPNDFLQSLQCEIDTESQHSWLFRLVRSPKGSQHPLHHLLLIQFLNHVAASFFQVPHQFKPFGKGPWLCLNQAAPHFHQPVIQTCEITYTQDHGKPVGTFYCSCGFMYCRTGPDETQEDPFRITKVRAFGSIWEEKLKNLWADSTVSLRAMARQLGVDPTTVKLHAAALELPFPRQSKRQTNKSHRVLVSSLKTQKTVSKVSLEDYRAEWLAARRDNPASGRTILKNQFQRVYAWLRRNDREWLEANMPAKKQAASPFLRVNWEHRDIELAEAVKSVATNLYKQAGKPCQVTVAAIARELGQLALIQKHADKLPWTSKALSELAETREAFALRRIQWVLECYVQEGVCPLRWRFTRRAGLRPEIELLPSVENAISRALVSLEHISSQYDRDCPPQRMAL